MQAMILAAGRGTRLGELGKRIPKALVEIGGVPLLAHQLAYLAAAGVDRAVVNAHHLAEQIVEFVEGRSHPMHVEVSVEPDLLGTAGGVRAALDRFAVDSPIIVIHADTIVEAPLRDLLAAHTSAAADATIAVNWLADTHGKGVVEVDEESLIVNFVEKPRQPRPGLANAGVYVVEQELLQKLAPEGQFCDFAIDLFPCALDGGRRLRAELIATPAHDIGTPDALAQARSAQGARKFLSAQTAARGLHGDEASCFRCPRDARPEVIAFQSRS
jgi:mannose-1-phosphate guanylyltransferase